MMNRRRLFALLGSAAVAPIAPAVAAPLTDEDLVLRPGDVLETQFSQGHLWIVAKRGDVNLWRMPMSEVSGNWRSAAPRPDLYLT